MTDDDFRNIALALNGAIESAHMGHPDFRVQGKIFASLGAPSQDWAMVKLTPEQQRSFVDADPSTFKPCNGAWGVRGATNVFLASAKKSLVRAALQMASENFSQGAPKPTKKFAKRSKRHSD